MRPSLGHLHRLKSKPAFSSRSNTSCPLGPPLILAGNSLVFSIPSTPVHPLVQYFLRVRSLPALPGEPCLHRLMSVFPGEGHTANASSATSLCCRMGRSAPRNSMALQRAKGWSRARGCVFCYLLPVGSKHCLPLSLIYAIYKVGGHDSAPPQV